MRCLEARPSVWAPRSAALEGIGSNRILLLLLVLLTLVAQS